MPIIAFLFVFILVYAILKKTEILGDNNAVAIFIALILAVFFIANVQLVDFVKFSSAWIGVFVVCLFLILLLVGLMGKDALKLVTESKGVGGAIVFLVIVFFIISSAYTFNWAVNWDKISSWFTTDWFGLILLLVVAGIVGWVLSKK